MTQIKLPLTDFAQTTPLKAGAARGVRLRATASIKTDKDGARLFRELLGAMAHGGKASTAACTDTIGPAVRTQPSNPALTVTEPTNRTAAVDVSEPEAEEEEPAGTGVEISPELPPSDIAIDAKTWTPPLAADASLAADRNRRQDMPGPATKTGDRPVLADVARTDGGQPPVVSKSSQVIAELRTALSAPATPPGSDTKAVSASADAPTFEQTEAVEIRNSAPAKVTVVNQETHLVPAPGPVQQIVDVVQAEIPGLIGQTTATQAETTPTQVNQSPVKILTIRLDPPALGEVTVKMRLQGDGLELHLVAAQRDTAQMLQQQRELLTGLIRDIGYVTDVASVQQADVATVTLSANTQQLSSGPGQQDTSASSRGGDAEQRSGGGQADARESEQERQQWSQRRREHAPENDPRAASGRAVYL